IEEAFECIGAAFRLHFHGAIVAVANIALKAQSAGGRLSKIAEAAPLDVAHDFGLEVTSFRSWQPRRARAGRWSRRPRPAWAHPGSPGVCAGPRAGRPAPAGGRTAQWAPRSRAVARRNGSRSRCPP